MLTAEEIGGLFEAVVWKSGLNNGKLYVWSNVYPLVNQQGYKQELAYEACHNICMAEAALNFTDTKILGAVLYELPIAGEGPTEDNCYAFSTWHNGTRGQDPETVRLPYEWALRISRDATQGKSGHWMYRNCISTAEAVPFRENDWALGSGEVFGLHEQTFWRHWINTHDFNHVIFSRNDEAQFPAAVRLVYRVSISGLAKMQSQMDAQDRKAAPGLMYKAMAEEAVIKAFEAMSVVHAAQMWAPGDVPRGVALGWVPAVGELHGILVNLKEFWESGQDPALALKARPTGAHDWNLGLAASARSAAETGSGNWVQALTAALPEDVEWLPAMQAADFRKKLNLIVYHVQRIMLARFIGNPINALVPGL